MSTPAAGAKRIFLRARTSSADQAGLQDHDLVDLFLTKAGSDKEDTGQHTRHFVHSQPREYKHFHIILDINYKQEPDANVKELIHEVYQIHFDNPNTEPSFNRIEGPQALRLAMEYTGIYAWGKQR